MARASTVAPMGTHRAVAAWTATGTFAAAAVVALVDPNRPGRYPSCPTRLLTGLDCPACGTLRGLHELSRGHLGAALDHNVLLLAAIPFGLWLWFRWARTAATGTAAPAVVYPRWVVPVMVTVAIIFTLARNLPIAALTWLDAA